MKILELITRVVATLLDHLLLSLSCFVLGLVAYKCFGPQEITLSALRLEWYRQAIILGYLGAGIMYVCYHFSQEVYGSGTVGKVLFGLKMRTSADERPARRALFARHILKFVVIYLTFVGGMIVIWPLRNELANALILRSSYHAEMAFQVALSAGSINAVEIVLLKYSALVYVVINALLLVLPTGATLYDLVTGITVRRYTDQDHYQQKIENERRQQRMLIASRKEALAKKNGQAKEAVDELLFK